MPLKVYYLSTWFPLVTSTKPKLSSLQGQINDAKIYYPPQSHYYPSK